MGDITSRDRFARLSYFLHYTSEFEPDGTTKDPDTLLADLRSTFFSVAVPQGAPDSDPWDSDVYPTWWYLGYDFTRSLATFQFTRNPSAFTVNITALTQKSEVLYLVARDPALHGDVTNKFVRPPKGAAPQQVRHSVHDGLTAIYQ